jgi:hypothetical protein
VILSLGRDLPVVEGLVQPEYSRSTQTEKNKKLDEQLKVGLRTIQQM